VEELGVGERPPALQGDVIWHDASLNSAQLVDNMPPGHSDGVTAVPAHKGLARRSALFMLVIRSVDARGHLRERAQALAMWRGDNIRTVMVLVG
jgi:hypothetical protein